MQPGRFGGILLEPVHKKSDELREGEREIRSRLFNEVLSRARPADACRLSASDSFPEFAGDKRDERVGNIGEAQNVGLGDLSGLEILTFNRTNAHSA